MPRAPRYSLAGVKQSLDLADAVETILHVLRCRHPNDGNLAAVAALMAGFSHELTIAAPVPPSSPETPELPTE